MCRRRLAARWALTLGALLACRAPPNPSPDAGASAALTSKGADSGDAAHAAVDTRGATHDGDDAGGAALDALARVALLRAAQPALAYAAVTRATETVGAVGLADVDRHVPATPDTAFEAASIAKTIIATCVMQLVEEGRLDLDAEISRYVGFPVRHPRWPEPITLRMLLTHRASIADREDEIAAGRQGHPLDAFLRSYVNGDAGPRAAAFLPARPGTTAAYSNVGASLAALAVERVAGESFAARSTRSVFVPLRMTNTGWTAAPREGVVLATPHAARDGGFAALPQASHALYPVVDLRSSARDLARFVRAILHDGELDGARILAPSSVRAMLRPADDAGGLDGLGWQLRELGGARVAGHEGEDRGATTALFLDPIAGTGAVVLGNGDAFSSGDRERTAAIEGLLADLLASAR